VFVVYSDDGSSEDRQRHDDGWGASRRTATVVEAPYSSSTATASTCPELAARLSGVPSGAKFGASVMYDEAELSL